MLNTCSPNHPTKIFETLPLRDSNTPSKHHILRGDRSIYFTQMDKINLDSIIEHSKVYMWLTITNLIKDP